MLLLNEKDILGNLGESLTVKYLCERRGFTLYCDLNKEIYKKHPIFDHIFMKNGERYFNDTKTRNMYESNGKINIRWHLSTKRRSEDYFTSAKRFCDIYCVPYDNIFYTMVQKDDNIISIFIVKPDQLIVNGKIDVDMRNVKQYDCVMYRERLIT